MVWVDEVLFVIVRHEEWGGMLALCGCICFVERASRGWQSNGSEVLIILASLLPWHPTIYWLSWLILKEKMRSFFHNDNGDYFSCLMWWFYLGLKSEHLSLFLLDDFFNKQWINTQYLHHIVTYTYMRPVIITVQCSTYFSLWYYFCIGNFCTQIAFCCTNWHDLRKILRTFFAYNSCPIGHSVSWLV
jgi:hypothetical protein